MNCDVRDKVVLVTGANRGIGKAIVESLCEHGAAKVYAAVRNLSSAEPLVQTFGERVVPVEVDLSRPETIVAAASTAADAQIVINNAGVFHGTRTLADDAAEQLQSALEVNVFGLLRMAQAFAPVLKRNGGGAFVQLNSVVSLKCFPDFTTYCASKAAAYSITQGLRADLQPQGTLVVSVHPGPISTGFADEAGLTGMGEPPSVVAEALITALKNGEFHVFPDSMARQTGEAYASFAANVIEANAAGG